MGKKLRLTALLVLVPALLYAGAETGADILKERTGIRAVSMGGAYTAVANDVESVNYNPAGIADISGREVEIFAFVSPLNYIDANVFYAAYAQPFESPLIDGFYGLSAVYRGIPDISNIDATDDPVSYYDMALTASYASAMYQFIKDDLFKSITFGLSAKLLFEQIGPHRGSTLAFDAGVKFAPSGTGLKLGAAILNAGLPLKLIRGDAQPGDAALSASPLPLTLRIGAAYSLAVDKNNTTLFSADYIHDFYSFGQAAIGIEHNLIDILFLRLGYSQPVDLKNPAAMSAGAGIYITTVVPVQLTVGFNYAYRLVLWDWFNAPDSTHAFSVILKF